MPKYQETWTVKAPSDKCWAFFSDLKNLASCMPGFINLEIIDDKSQIWTIDVEVSRMKRQATFKGFIQEMKPPTYAKFTLEGISEKLSGSGTASVEAAGPNETKVSFFLDVEATGLLRAVINPAIKGTVEKMGKGFVANSTAALEGKPKPK